MYTINDHHHHRALERSLFIAVVSPISKMIPNEKDELSHFVVWVLFINPNTQLLCYNCKTKWEWMFFFIYFLLFFLGWKWTFRFFIRRCKEQSTQIWQNSFVKSNHHLCLCYWAIKKSKEISSEKQTKLNPRTKWKQEKRTNDQSEFPHFVFRTILFCERLWHASCLGSREIYGSMAALWIADDDLWIR